MLKPAVAFSSVLMAIFLPVFGVWLCFFFSSSSFTALAVAAEEHVNYDRPAICQASVSILPGFVNMKSRGFLVTRVVVSDLGLG